MALSLSAARIGIVGGGLSGSLAALVLKSRGASPTILDLGRRSPGGRLAGGEAPDSGAQFLSATDADSQFAQILAMLEREQLVARWRGRLGILGSQGGGFLPAEIISKTAVAGMMKAGSGAGNVGDGADFCGFVGAASAGTYVGTPSNAHICTGVCSAAGIEVLQGTRVEAALPRPEGGWQLTLDGAGGTKDFDALILATHDPSLAGAAVRALLPRLEAEPEAAAVMRRLASDLQAQRDERTEPVFSCSLYLPQGFSEAVRAQCVPAAYFALASFSSLASQPLDDCSSGPVRRSQRARLADCAVPSERCLEARSGSDARGPEGRHKAR